ncbi:MAG: alpha-L-fucosidase [Candidatus Thorarchaeota archaeon]
MEKNEKEWWEKPGLGIMYQIEARPGWIWNRNYDKFNASMRDENGKFRFNGPFCKMKKWVEFSKKVGVDYHVFEAKWHDGICYWDTKFTDWKTPEDYCKIYAKESTKAGIPFMFYYSSVFDHNPQFDDIQPLRCTTPSYIAMHSDKKEKIAKFSMGVAKAIENAVKSNRNERGEYNIEFFDDVNFHDFKYNPEKYEDYLINQIKELIDNYKPTGMWMDWYSEEPDASTFVVMDFLERDYPEVILTYNVSIEKNPRHIHYLSGEAHDVKVAWRAGNRNRLKETPWELCGPVAYGWDVPLARSDPFEIFRIAAIIMASGGKFCFGLPSQMDGELYPEPAKNLEKFGDWYKKRKKLFTEAVPMNYNGEKVPGVEINNAKFGIIGSIVKNYNLIHIINFEGIKKDLVIKLSPKQWGTVEKIFLEPDKKQLFYNKQNNSITVNIKKEDIDITNTILRIIKK